LGLLGIALSTAAVHCVVGSILLITSVTDARRFISEMGVFLARIAVAILAALMIVELGTQMAARYGVGSPIGYLQAAVGIVVFIPIARLLGITEYTRFAASLKRTRKAGL
jgi:hypothetical protein